jgi:hypothetical protein
MKGACLEVKGARALKPLLLLEALFYGAAQFSPLSQPPLPQM